MNLEIIKELLQQAFPNPGQEIPEAAARLIARALPEKVQESVLGQVLGELLDSEIPYIENEYVIDYYEVFAQHQRHGAGSHSFTSIMPMVRVLMPDHHEDVSTKIGILYAGDRLQPTKSAAIHRMRSGMKALAEQTEKHRKPFSQACRKVHEGEITRVEITSGARFMGVRFAPVSIEVHFNGATPVAYRLEMAMPNGSPIIDFLGPLDWDMEPRISWYAPTPMSNETDYYGGSCIVDKKTGEPVRLELRKTAQDKINPSLIIKTKFTRVTHPSRVWPAKLIAEMALRVAAIAAKMKLEQVQRTYPLLAKLTAAGRDLRWEEKP